MIFIILGTQKFQFNRLLKLIDEYIADGLIREDVTAQIGFSDYVPQNYKYERFFDKEQFIAMIAKSEMLITHGGATAISIAVKLNKPILIFPRLKKYGEHVDDHQTEIGKTFEKEGYALCCDENSDFLELLTRCCTESFKAYESKSNKIVDTIDAFLSKSK